MMEDEELYQVQKEYAKLMGEALKLFAALMAVSFDERLPEDVRSNTKRSLEEFKQW